MLHLVLRLLVAAADFVWLTSVQICLSVRYVTAPISKPVRCVRRLVPRPAYRGEGLLLGLASA